jgi:hypothetical protein
MPMHMPSGWKISQRELFSPPTKLPQLPAEAHQKMVRLLARMLNEHLLRRPSPATSEVGDE